MNVKLENKMEYKTSRFGMIKVPDGHIYEFPKGIIGFEKENLFVILKHRPDSSFFWLQSLQTPELAFSLLFPFEFYPVYNPSFEKEDLSFFGVETKKELDIYAMVVIPKEIKDMTMNLLSPIVVNPKNKRGAQVILKESEYSVRHKVLIASK